MKELKIIKKHYHYKGYENRLSSLDVTYPLSDAVLPIVIFAHGFKGFKDWGAFDLIAEEFAKNGFLFLKFNFSHNGGTVSNPIDFPDLEAFSKNTYSKELYDLTSILDFTESELKTIIDRRKIYLIGHSRGGAISIISASNEVRVAKIISWAAVDDFVNRLPNKLEMKNWKSVGFRNIFNSRTKQNMHLSYAFVEDLLINRDLLTIKKAQERIQIPQLIIHGEKDETVEPQAAINLHKWNPSSKLLLIEKAGHTFGMKHPNKEKKLPIELVKMVKESMAFLKN